MTRCLLLDLLWWRWLPGGRAGRGQERVRAALRRLPGRRPRRAEVCRAECGVGGPVVLPGVQGEVSGPYLAAPHQQMAAVRIEGRYHFNNYCGVGRQAWRHHGPGRRGGRQAGPAAGRGECGGGGPGGGQAGGAGGGGGTDARAVGAEGQATRLVSRSAQQEKEEEEEGRQEAEACGKTGRQGPGQPAEGDLMTREGQGSSRRTGIDEDMNTRAR